jgi:methyltransferase (TIGR00027 family)
MRELANIPVLEIDRASMIARKEHVLDGSGRKSSRVRRVCVDFHQDNLGTHLTGADWSANLKTLFIWEGVTNYLDAESVDAVFDFFAQGAPAGSRIIFTYVHVGVLEGAFAAPGLERLTAVLRDYGEPWTFGFEPKEVPGYLQQKGIQLLFDLGAAEYRQKYMPPVKKPIGYEFYRVALAEKVRDAAG